MSAKQGGLEDCQECDSRRKRGTLKRGRSGDKVKSRKQGIAIGLSEACKKGKKIATADTEQE